MNDVETFKFPWVGQGPRTVPQAFPYQGSKRQLARKILSLFPEPAVELLVEPFAGSAAIAVASRFYGTANKVFISDVNAPVMDLWKAIRDEPDQLIEQYSKYWNDQLSDPKSYFRKVRSDFNRDHEPAALLYLLNRIVKAAIRYNQKTGEFNQGADNRRLGANPSVVEKRIKASSLLMQRAVIAVESYEESLLLASKNALVYMDPPYQGTSDVSDHRYLQGLSREAFSKNLAEAVKNETSFIVSYDVVTDDNKYGYKLPEELDLMHRHLLAGTSSQATLNGRQEKTVESLYLSPALVKRLGGEDAVDSRLRLAES